jgi:beta-mannanase
MATTVSGSATIGGTTYSATAEITLPAAPVTPPPASGSGCNLAVYDVANDLPSSWSGEAAFTAAGCPLKMATMYIQWPSSGQASNWPTNLANLAEQAGTGLMVEMEPWFTSTTWPTFTSIAAGQYDAYLEAMARSAAAFKGTLYMTYAHEQNGSWYPWGAGGAEGVTAAQWVASWQHVVSTMSAIAPNITWVWAPNNIDVGSSVPFWPGAEYVGQVAWDGYLQNEGQTYSNFLAQTVTELRTLTDGPIWLSETGIEPAGSDRAARITSFLADLQAAGISGFCWFNQAPFALSAAEMPVFAAAVKAWNAG